jgi:hypothetical protein
MPNKSVVASPELINQVVLDELISRRSESMAAVANSYLRGTVLVALSTTQISIIVTLNSYGSLKVALMLWALVSGALGLITFWPRKKIEFTAKFMKDYLATMGRNTVLSYQAYLESEYLQEQAVLTRNSLLHKIGFSMALFSFFPMLAIVLVGEI